MSCVLRVWGNDLDIDALLEMIKIEAYRVWHKGDPVSSKAALPIQTYSGACFTVSDAKFHEFEHQVEDAISFLERSAGDISFIAAFPGVEGAAIDFGIELRQVFVHCDYLPPKLLALAGPLGIGIELSHYPIADDDSDEVSSENEEPNQNG